MNPNRDAIIRIGKAVLVHLVLMAIAYGALLMLLGDFDSASDTVRDTYDEAGVMQQLAAARAQLLAWYLGGLIVSLIASAVFLFAAQQARAKVRSASEGRRSLPLWIVLFLVVAVLTGFVWWRQVSIPSVAALVLDSDYLWLVTLGSLFPLLAYWLSTGLAVTITLKPSVPGAGLLPRMWN